MNQQSFLIITYSDSVVTVKTHDPAAEILNAIKRGGVISIIKDNIIIYTKPIQL